MDMKNKTSIKDFNKRLAALRKVKGLTQTELGKKVGVSKRVITYYETKSKYPPAHLIAPLAKALHMSTDELVGLKGVKLELDPEHAALWRRLKKVETLSVRDKKALFHYLNLLLKKNETV